MPQDTPGLPAALVGGADIVLKVGGSSRQDDARTLSISTADDAGHED